jgi:hypothetical protein
MGRKKLERPCAEQISSMISSMLVPSHILETLSHIQIRIIPTSTMYRSKA